jgi:hypothetical protein
MLLNHINDCTVKPVLNGEIHALFNMSNDHQSAHRRCKSGMGDQFMES